MLSVIDVFGLILVLATAAVCLVISLLVVGSFAHPKDALPDASPLGYFAVVAGTCLALLVAAAPVFDIFFAAKARFYTFGFELDGVLLWQVLLFLVLIAVLANSYALIVPAPLHLAPTPSALAKWAVLPILYSAVALSIWIGFGSFGYFAPVYSLDLSSFDLSESNNIFDNEMEVAWGAAYTNISLVDAFFVPLVLLGSLLFAACAGAGLATFPVDMISRYVYRPRKVEPDEYVIAKKILQKESEAAIRVARNAYDIKRELAILAPSDDKRRKNLSKSYKKKLAAARAALAEFEHILEAFKADEDILESNPLTFYGYLALGVVGATVSGLVILQTLMSIVGIQGALEYLVLRTESDSFVLAAFVFLGIAVYISVAIVYGSAPVSAAFEGLLPPVAIKQEGTFRESFHQALISTLLGQFGMVVYLVRFLPRYLRYLGFDFYVHRVLTRLTLISHFYRYSLFEWLFLGAFLVSLFVCTFSMDGAVILRQKVAERMAEIEGEKEEMAKLDKVAHKVSIG